MRQNPFVSMDELITCAAVVFNRLFYETSVHSVCSLKKKRVSYGDQRAANIGLCTENNVLIYCLKVLKVAVNICAYSVENWKRNRNMRIWSIWLCLILHISKYDTK